MNPDEQNNNPTANPNPPVDFGATPPASEPTAMDAAASSEAPAPEGATTPEPSVPETNAATDNLMGNAPAADSLADLGNTADSSPADTTFTPVTAGEETPISAATPDSASAPEETTTPTPDAAAPTPGAADAANPAAPGMVGAPAKKKISTTTIILMVVAGVAIIGVVVALILSNIK